MNTNCYFSIIDLKKRGWGGDKDGGRGKSSSGFKGFLFKIRIMFLFRAGNGGENKAEDTEERLKMKQTSF